jgi:hypothetical protein
MTEYDLTAKQLIDTLSLAVRAALKEDWPAVAILIEDSKLLAQHIRPLRALPDAP